MLSIFNMVIPMSFNEKSAWIMMLALLAGGVIYFGVVLSASLQLQELASPTLPLVAAYTGVLVLVAIIGHVLVAIYAPDEASTVPDERERSIANQACVHASMLVASGALLSLLLYLLTGSGDLLFYTVFASLMLGQLAGYVSQIVLYRVAT
ncbi:MAG: hypothetical protein PsegKO_09960 [Pseudohongiellaceae bacterium]